MNPVRRALAIDGFMNLATDGDLIARIRAQLTRSLTSALCSALA
jgi:hypothetical protein